MPYLFRTCVEFVAAISYDSLLLLRSTNLPFSEKKRERKKERKRERGGGDDNERVRQRERKMLRHNSLVVSFVQSA